MESILIYLRKVYNLGDKTFKSTFYFSISICNYMTYSSIYLYSIVVGFCIVFLCLYRGLLKIRELQKCIQPFTEEFQGKGPFCSFFPPWQQPTLLTLKVNAKELLPNVISTNSKKMKAISFLFFLSMCYHKMQKINVSYFKLWIKIITLLENKILYMGPLA